MNIHHVSSQGFHLRDEFLRLNYHQVYIQGLLAQLGHMFQNWKSEGDVGHEDTVHDIDVQPVSAAVVEPFHVSLQIAEVGRQK